MNEVADSRRLTASLVIMDFLTGRMKGGHQEDYLAALEQALEASRPVTVAPYREKWPVGARRVDIPVPESRFARYATSVRLCKCHLDAAEQTLMLFPNADFRDFVVFAVASSFRRRRGRGLGVFMMRRDGAGITGSAWLGRVLELIVRWLCVFAPFFMVSDARAAMAYWQALTGVSGPIVSIPVRLPPEVAVRVAGEGIVVGLLGAFRLEKGAAHYDIVIDEVLAADPDARVECQISTAGRPAEQLLGNALTTKWRDHPRVTLHDGHLSRDDFTRLLYCVDIIVLPYDAENYGTGTSGIMFEAIAAGKNVLVTPILWGRNEFGDNPSVVWLKDTARPSLVTGLHEAIRRWRNRSVQASPLADQFRESWIAALLQAQATVR